MSDALRLFGTEVLRCLSRRVVWALVAIACIGIVAVSFITFVNTGGEDGRVDREAAVQQCMQYEEGPRARVEAMCRQAIPPDAFDDRLRLTDLWPEEQGDGDSILSVTVIFLAIGALLGGASMVGGDWKAGTMATLLTWEPRRVRLALARFAAVVVLAMFIGFALQLLLILGLLPSILAHGTTEGADASWFRTLFGGLLRCQVLVGVTALFGAAVAMIGRNTAAAMGAAFAYMLIGENVVRAWKPWLRPWLLAENAFIFLSGYTPADIGIGRGFGAAAVTLVAYAVGFAAGATFLFHRRDVATT
jgi:hypothetical protein